MQPAALVAPALLAQRRAARAVRLAAAHRRRRGAGRARAPGTRARYRLDARGHARADSGGNWSISGPKSVVPAGDEADAFIVPARVGGAVDDAAASRCSWSSAAPGVAGARLPDARRRARGRVTSGRAAGNAAAARRPRRARSGDRRRHRRALRRGRRRDGQAGRATVEYMNTRKQFGVAHRPPSRRCATASPTSRCSSSWRAR